MRSQVIGLLMLVVGCLSGSLSAALITEHFNAYGSTASNLSGKGSAGDGWAGSWTGGAGVAFPQYAPGTQLSFANPAYRNQPNGQSLTDGAVTSTASASASGTSSRAFSTGLTGTIWISMLTRLTSDSNANVLLWLDGGNHFASIRSGKQAELRYNGVSDGDEFGPAPDVTYAADTTYLFLLRVDMNNAGSADAVKFWIKSAAADLSSEILLGTPSFSKSGADAFGSTFDALALSFQSAGNLADHLRISTAGPTRGLLEVLIVPEPTAGLGVLGSLLWLGSRRRGA